VDYVSDLALRHLGWLPKYDFVRIFSQIPDDEPISSRLAQIIRIKGYHSDVPEDGPYPVD
jgi:hypothetical protein